MRCAVFLYILGLLATMGGTARAQEFDHSPWDRVLKKYVTEVGRVDYATLKADSGDLDRWLR